MNLYKSKKYTITYEINNKIHYGRKQIIILQQFKILKKLWPKTILYSRKYSFRTTIYFKNHNGC